MKPLFKKKEENKSFQYLVLSIISSGINMLTLIAFGRVFSVNEYAVISTLQALASNITIIMMPLQFMICKTIAKHDDNLHEQINSLICIFIFINLCIIIGLIIFTKPLMKYLSFSFFLEYVLFLLLILLSNLYIFFNGIIQGKQFFILLGWIGVIFYCTKLICGIGLGSIKMGVNAVVIGSIIAFFICILIFFLRFKNVICHSFRILKIQIEKKYVLQYFNTIITYLVISLFMNNGDILIANIYCSKIEIGFYSVAANLAKISIFLIATPLASLLLPQIAAENNKLSNRRRIWITVSLTLGVSILYEMVLFFFRNRIIAFLYGDVYIAASQYLFSCGIYSVVLGVFWVLYHYSLATEDKGTISIFYIFIGIIMIIIIIYYKPSIDLIPIIMSCSMLLIILCALFLKRKQKEKKQNTILE